MRRKAARVEGTNALMIRASVMVISFNFCPSGFICSFIIRFFHVTLQVIIANILSTSQVASKGITSEKKRGSVNIDRVGNYWCFGNSWFYNIAEC